MKNLLTVNEVAGILRVHPGHIRRLVSNKKIRFCKIVNVGIRFALEDIELIVKESAVEVIDWDEKARDLTGKK